MLVMIMVLMFSIPKVSAASDDFDNVQEKLNMILNDETCAVVVYSYTGIQEIVTGDYLELYYYTHAGWRITKLQSFHYAWFAGALYLNR